MDQTMSVAEWEARYAAADRALRDVRHLLDLGSRVAPGTGESRGRAEVLVGGDKVRRAPRVGVFAGSFNPLTLAHTGLADAARAQLDALLWALSRVTVDKERVTRASLADRVAQLETHTAHSPGADGVVVMDAGLYADQAVSLRGALAPNAELWLIVGYDKIVQIFDPRYYDNRTLALDRLFSAARLLVAPRDGYGEQALASLLASPENREYAQHVRFLQVPIGLETISSTAARHLVEAPAGVAPRELAGLLPPEGAALALTTWAYASPMRLESGELVDRYALRLAWLQALDASPPEAVEQVDLGACVDAAASPTADGARMRRWLRGERWLGGPHDPLDLLRDVR